MERGFITLLAPPVDSVLGPLPDKDGEFVMPGVTAVTDSFVEYQILDLTVPNR